MAIENGSSRFADSDSGAIYGPALPPSIGPALPAYIPRFTTEFDAVRTPELRTTALHLAVRAGDTDHVRELLANCEPIEARDDGGSTALHIAAKEGRVEVLRILLEHGADVASRDDAYYPYTALHHAIKIGPLDAVCLLFDHGADSVLSDEERADVLGIAAFESHIPILRFLLDHGFPVRPGKLKLTAVHQAAQSGKPDALDIVRLLVTYGGDVRAVDFDGRSVLYFASQTGHEAVVRLLLEDFGVPAREPGQRFPALHTATVGGHTATVRILLEHGADVAARDPDARTALHDAVYSGSVEIVRLLLDAGCDVHAQTDTGMTALHYAAMYGHADILQLLLDRGADVNVFGRNGTPLHCATDAVPPESAVQVSEILLEHGADANVRDGDGFLPIQRARMKKKGALVRLLHRHLSGVEAISVLLEDEPAPPQVIDMDKVYADYKAQDYLGQMLAGHYIETKSLDDLSVAIAALERANELDPDGYRSLSLLSQCYFLRYAETEDIADLDIAIEIKQDQMILEPRAYDEFHHVDSFGVLLLSRYEACQDPADIDRAMHLYHSASATGYRAASRFQSASRYADLCLEYKSASASLRAYKLAADFAQDVCSPHLPLRERYLDIGDVRKTHDSAVAAAIEAKDFSLALEWFERWRCIAWSHILRLRAPVDEIRDVAPKLADEIEDLLSQISDAEKLSEADHRTPGQVQAVYRYGTLIDRLDELLSRARQLPEHETFLQPKTLEELREAAALGPIVAIHVDKTRCDALILRYDHDDVLHVPLPDLTLPAAERMRDNIRNHVAMSAIRGSRPTVNRAASMAPSLLVLWTRVVQPVLDALGFTHGEPPEQLPRITWCASGPLALLPLHAAGLYKPGGKKAFDYAVHSFTPSLTALLNAYNQSKSAANVSPAILAVSQPSTPNQEPLPGTIAEVETVQHVTKAAAFTWLNDDKATADAVLMQIGRHPWVHLACHAIQASLDPMESGFLLHDGSISLRAIMRRTAAEHTGNALAVLSACQTATGDGKLTEEAMHLAAGMLMTGFRSVVGTMWSIGDGDAPIVMEAFYSYLMDRAQGDSRQSAQALHEAVRRLREHVGEESFLQWVPFIHFGV